MVVLTWLVQTDFAGGYLYVDSILKKPQFTRFTVEDVHSVVENNSKQRFHLEVETDTGRLKIRANQGHSLQVVLIACLLGLFALLSFIALYVHLWLFSANSRWG